MQGFLLTISIFCFSVMITCCTGFKTKKTWREPMVSHFKSHVDMAGNDVLNVCENHLQEANALKNQLLRYNEGDPFSNTLNLYNDILVHIDAAMSPASLLSQVHPDEKTRKEAEICEQDIASFLTDLSLDKNVFYALKRGESADLNQEERRMLDHTLRDFTRAGVDKDDLTRERIRALNKELVIVGQQFSQNIREETFHIVLDDEKDLMGLPKDYIEAHKPDMEGKIKISTDYPDYVPFMRYAKNDQLRKKLRFLYLNRGKANGPVLGKMIEKRHELADLLGYRSFADYIVEDKMIKSVKAVSDFIEKITAIAKASADKEYSALLAFKKKSNPDATAIYGYENAFLEEAYKKEKFDFDSQQTRPYFAYDRVRDGLLNLTSKLFEIRYVPVPDAKVWHESVEVYDVYDESLKLGRIYLDMHPREGKYKHAAQFTVRSGLNNRQYPEGALVCNFPDPKNGFALMEHREVVTMFHEFGHLLHHLFAGKQEFMSFSGVATEWDFVEAPSQLLEEWAWSSEVLQAFAKHYKNDEPIPVDLVVKMRAADEFGKALSARQQMFYAALSLDYYLTDPKNLDLLERLKSLQAKYSYFPYEEGTHFHHSFGHLDGYSAMYYTYMWSLSLAKDLFEPFRKDGIMNLDHANRFKNLVLKPGGSKDAKNLVEDFLGRPFKFDAFERWLVSDPLAFTRATSPLT